MYYELLYHDKQVKAEQNSKRKRFVYNPAGTTYQT